MKDRFKVGDRVVKVADKGMDSHSVGSKGVITQVDGDGCPWAKLDGAKYNDPWITDNYTEFDCIDQREWEYEHIVNTPLYKALG